MCKKYEMAAKVVPVSNMQCPLLLINEIREVLSRVLKVENAIETLTVSQQTAQAHQWEAIQSVKGEIQRLHQEHRAFQEVVATNLNNSRSPLLSPSSSKEASPEQHCGFPLCSAKLSATNRSCSAAQSLRHMIDCQHCPDGERFLRIAQHMLKFQKSPRVVPVDICCWCGLNFGTLVTTPNVDTPDARSRHRKSCQQAVISRLQDPASRDAAAQMLSEIWTQNEEPVSKRSREQQTQALDRRKLDYNSGEDFFNDELLSSTRTAAQSPDQKWLDVLSD